VFVADFTHALFADIKRFIPRDWLEFAFTTFANPDLRLSDAILMIDVLGHRQGAGTGAALIPGMIFVAFYLDELAILNKEVLTATTVTSSTGGPCCCWIYVYLSHNTKPSSKSQISAFNYLIYQTIKKLIS
jgi:hypothetical protein